MASSAKLRVAIIGAGASGLPAIKCCLDDGLEPVCFERTSDIGGLWNYENSLKEGDGYPSVTKSTVINTSKEMMCYSDFPIPEDYPNFMHNKMVMQYFRLYAEHFKLLPYIRLETEVVRVSQADDFAMSGKWKFQIRNRQTKEETTEVYDAVLVCTGHHADKHMPKFEGEENFKGQRLHTHEFHDGSGYNDKRVVIIGIGNSGGDAAVELSRICSTVYLSTRRGSWVTNRVAHRGLPSDYLFNRRFVFDLRDLVPRFVVNGLFERELNRRVDHKLYGLQPKHHFDAQHVMVNDDLPNQIAAGRVVIKPDIRRITETGVEFEDGSVVDNIDTVIYATGYTFGFPFIDHPALAVKANQVSLFKFVFPPDIKPSTIGVVGCFQPLGAIMPISEQQCRWAVRVFKGERPLPSAAEMWADVHYKRDEMAKRYVKSQRHTIQIDYVPFIQELAKLTGNQPDLKQLAKTEPLLALRMYFGPMTPYHMRVMGHGAWPGARQAIMTTWDRVAKPFNSRKLTEDSRGILKSLLLYAIILLVVAWFFGWLF